jgi:hypothetical protein
MTRDDEKTSLQEFHPLSILLYILYTGTFEFDVCAPKFQSHRNITEIKMRCNRDAVQ